MKNINSRVSKFRSLDWLGSSKALDSISDQTFFDAVSQIFPIFTYMPLPLCIGSISILALVYIESYINVDSIVRFCGNSVPTQHHILLYVFIHISSV